MNADLDLEQLVSLMQELPALWDKSCEDQSRDESIIYAYVSFSELNLIGKGD